MLETRAPLPPGWILEAEGLRVRALELEGPAAADLLSSAVMLDLDAGAFPAGSCARTLFGKAPALLWRPESARFVLRTPRSCARYALGLLKAGAAGL